MNIDISNMRYDDVVLTAQQLKRDVVISVYNNNVKYDVKMVIV